MSPDALLEALLELARELELEVRSAGREVDGLQTSGLCRLRERVFLVLAAGDPVERRVELLARALRQHAPGALEERYLPPAVREALEVGEARTINPA